MHERARSSRADVAPIAVLLCDDHPTFGRGLGTLLAAEADDISVVAVATNGTRAEQLVNELLPDVVLMDVRMPDVDGIEATRRIRSTSPSTRVVMLTVSDDIVDLRRALHAGACGWIGKDRDAAEVVDVIRSVHRGHLVLPAILAESVVATLDATDDVALSDEERTVLAGIARGETNRELANRMHMSDRTLRRRIEDIYSKLHLANRIHAALWAREHGIGGLDDRTRDGGGR